MKEKLETDPRYKAVESSALREELYKQYMEKQAKVKRLLWMFQSCLFTDVLIHLYRGVSASDAVSCLLV